MKKFLSLGLAVLMAGCATPTTTPTKPAPKPTVPMPPMPNGLLPAPKLAMARNTKAMLFTPESVSFDSVPEDIVYTPGQTNVITIRPSYTNSVVWTNLSKTNVVMGWRTNKVVTGIVLAYPTNAWNWALQFSDGVASTSKWGIARLSLTNANWRTTNGQWFEVALANTNGQRFYRLTRTNYTARLLWDSHPESNILSGFKVYIGTATRTYTESSFISNLDSFAERRYSAGYGFVLTNMNVMTSYYIAVTALSNDDPPLESDYSNEVFLNRVIE